MHYSEANSLSPEEKEEATKHEEDSWTECSGLEMQQEMIIEISSSLPVCVSLFLPQRLFLFLPSQLDLCHPCLKS